MNRKLMLLIWPGVGLLLFTLALAACGSSYSTSTTTGVAGISLRNDIQPVFNTNCVVCHQGAAPPGGLSLEPGAAYKNLVNAPSTEGALKLVAPGAPEQSYLLNKLRGTQLQVGGSGAQMPYGASPLPDSQISLIQQWITAGAPDN
jgi:mono/diheme cytochrome c family protein